MAGNEERDFLPSGTTMSFEELPEGFLKMKFKSWAKLPHEVRDVIVELANKQKFKCALCFRDRGLIVEHDHYPEEGPGHPITIYNIRGLVCSGCNWHLM